MAERAAVFNRPQVGKETTAGVAVAASKRLHCTGIRPRPVTNVRPFRPVGGKFVTDVSQEKEMTVAAISGDLNYTDIIYFLSSVLMKVAVAGTWTFKPNPNDADALETLTVEVGSSVGAERFAYGITRSLEMVFSPTEATFSGEMIGRVLAHGITMTAAPTDVAKAIVSPKTIDVYVGDTVGGLARISRGFRGNVAIRNKLGPVMTLDSTEASFSAPVELAPDLTASLMLAKDSVGVGYMTDLRSSAQKFIRFKSTGGSYGAGNYDIQVTMPFKFNTPDPGEEQGVDVYTYGLIPNYEAAYASAIEVIVVNGIAAL